MGSKAKRQVIDGPMGILQGSRVLFSDYATDGPMWVGQGARESRHVIGFSEPFRRPPALLVGISLWVTDHNAIMRADLSAEEVTEHGFHLVFRTWGDSRIAQLRADWTAIGPVRDEDSWDIE